MNENEKIAREAAHAVLLVAGQQTHEPQEYRIILAAITRATERLQKELEASDKSLRAAITNSDELSGMAEQLRAQLAAANKRLKEAKQSIQREIDQSDCAACRLFLSGVSASLSTPATKEEKR